VSLLMSLCFSFPSTVLHNLSTAASSRTVAVTNSGSDGWYSEYLLRNETGQADYETSSACRLLERSGLVNFSKSLDDARVRLLSPTPLGCRVLDKIMSTAANRLWAGIQYPGRRRRLSEVTKKLKSANEALRGPLQLTI
jgi:hypothetical protein